MFVWQQIAIERQALADHRLSSDRFERQKSNVCQATWLTKTAIEALESELSLAQVDLRSLQESLLHRPAPLWTSPKIAETRPESRSPIDGVVIQVDIKVGETVIAGTTNIPGSTMMVIADPSETLTEVQVDEADIAQVREGQKLPIFSPLPFRIRRLTGTIQSIASVARAVNRARQSLSFLVKILLDEQDTMAIRPGMSVRADIYTETSEETLAVPVQAVLIEEELDEDEPRVKDEQSYVFVMLKMEKRFAGMSKRVFPVTVIRKSVEGLKEGEISCDFRTISGCCGI